MKSVIICVQWAGRHVLKNSIVALRVCPVTVDVSSDTVAAVRNTSSKASALPR